MAGVTANPARALGRTLLLLGARLVARLPDRLRRRVLGLAGVDRLRGVLYGTPRNDGPPVGELRAVVYLPTWAQWDVMRQRPQYVLAAFAAAGHEVWFIDPRERRARRDGDVHIVPSIRDVPGRGTILYIHYAPNRVYIDRFEDPVVVYDILDDLSIYEPFEQHTPTERRVGANHRGLVGVADILIASSETLVARHRQERPDILFVENGVDVRLFSTPLPRPADLPPPDPAHPIAGCHGAVKWLDFELLRDVAALRPEWRFVFVGPVDPTAREDVRGLETLDNVVFLGERPSHEMPAYAQAFDVGTIWRKVEHLTEAMSPLKMFEYIAAGTPCVATPLPACEAHPAVRVADSAPAFAAALDAALAERRSGAFTEKAAAASAAASWDARLGPVRARLAAGGRLRVGASPTAPDVTRMAPEQA